MIGKRMNCEKAIGRKQIQRWRRKTQRATGRT